MDEQIVTRDQAVGADAETIVMPVIEETLNVHKRRIETGGIRVHTTVHERQEIVDLPLLAETAEVERVPVNRIVETPPAVREEGDVLIIPVLEEVLVVEKRLMLKEELHIRRQRHEAHAPQAVTLRHEEVDIQRYEGDQLQADPVSSDSDLNINK